MGRLDRRFPETNGTNVTASTGSVRYTKRIITSPTGTLKRRFARYS